MKINNQILLLAPLLALLLPAAHAASYDDRDDRYGDHTNPGPAAPSTIPGQGDSKARVPIVKPAPVTSPKPRKPKTKTSPWGDSAANPPATPLPPVATQPAATPPAGGPVVVAPGQTPPPPSQPQPGTNDRLTEKFRGSSATGAGTAIIKGGASATDVSTQKITSTVLACVQNNVPRITRIQPANDASLQPGGSFIVHGLCFGDTPGKVQVTLPTQFGRIQAHAAKILDWDGEKILAQLPDNIVKAIPGDAEVEVSSAANARSTGKDFAFEPRMELVDLPAEGRVLKCVRRLANKCSIGGDTIATPAFTMPGNARGGFGSAATIDPRATFGGQVYSSEDLDASIGDIRGEHSYEVSIPPSASLSSCRVSTEFFETVRGVPDAVATVGIESNIVTVAWTLRATGERGWLSYSVYCKASSPAGVVAK